MNAVVELPESGGFTIKWWPKSIEKNGEPRVGRNYLQLNSIAAGKTVNDSFIPRLRRSHRPAGQANSTSRSTNAA